MRVLVIQIRQLGDVLLTTPLARVIKESIPGVRVSFLTGKNALEVVSDNPFIDDVLLIDDNPLSELKIVGRIVRKFDAVVDVQRTGRSSRITFLSLAPLRVAFFKKRGNFYYNRLVHWGEHGYTTFERMELLRGIGIDNPVREYLPEMSVSDKIVSSVRDRLVGHGITRFFVVAPTSRREGKRWPLAFFRWVSERLYKRYSLVPVIVYGPDEKSYVLSGFEGCSECWVPEDAFSIKELAALVGMSEFVISNDSFPAHVAVAVKKKLFVVLGPTSGWYPHCDFVHEIRKGLKCQPCRDEHNCPFGFQCLVDLYPEEVFEFIESKLDL